MDNDNYYLEKYAVIVNENNVPYKCTICNSFNEAIESIGEIFYDIIHEDGIEEDGYVTITKDNFEEFFRQDRSDLWIRKDFYDNPIDANVFILKIEG